jgi:beta-phosphoglucomutase-like phosphatase (HAD superfamily)
MPVEAVVFDLDGVLLDFEQLWNEAKHELVTDAGGRWREDAPRAMMGMSSTEWAAYLRDSLGVPPTSAVAIEDSSNGLRSAAAAGMTVIAVPNEHYPPDGDALDLAAATIDSLHDLTTQLVERAGR